MGIGNKFKLYRKLPIELRFKIWEDAADRHVMNSGPIYVEVRVHPYTTPEGRIRWYFSLRSEAKHQYVCPDERTVYERRFGHTSLRDNIGMIIFEPAWTQIVVDCGTLFTLFKWTVPWKSGIYSLHSSWGPGLGPEITNRQIKGLELIQELQIVKADRRGSAFLNARPLFNPYSITIEGIRLLRKHTFSASLWKVEVGKVLHPEAKAPYESSVRELIIREFAALVQAHPDKKDAFDNYEAQFLADVITFWAEVARRTPNHIEDEQRRDADGREKERLERVTVLRAEGRERTRGLIKKIQRDAKIAKGEDPGPEEPPTDTPGGGAAQEEDENANTTCAPS
ncbi:hypothetical protein BDZ45DRAFT_740984 [Acephala macrosclerotiorum]|nr:hypothetical protein BDZ45DRAFT_740984 [Acephala macrosclerotiorum]